ncbi:LysR family transcriptional regulator [Hydrogenophaga sp.]|uniref:LysR family transcriptional regulator n=1 Tax=Hydrogenophaga sp. TaxID=1904254 RepID=UPI002FCB6E9D
MDIKQLQNFCKVAEVGSLTAAASGLKLTQAALSRQLAMLESELQVALFRRTGRGLALTPPGQRLLEQAHLVLQQMAQIPRVVRGESKAGRLSLAVGLPPSLARTIVVPLVEAFQAEIPEVAMRSVDGLSANLMDLVAAGKLDCAVVYNTQPTDKVLLTPIADEDLYLVSGTAMPGAAELGSSVTLAEVALKPLITAGGSNAIHTTLSAALARLGKTAQVVHEIANLTAILDMVRYGHGYSVVPLSGVHSCIDDPALQLHRIRRPALSCSLFTAVPARTDDPLTVSELELLRKVVVRQLRQFDDEVEASIAARKFRQVKAKA